jgi:hypothetical protein
MKTNLVAQKISNNCFPPSLPAEFKHKTHTSKRNQLSDLQIQGSPVLGAVYIGGL